MPPVRRSSGRATSGWRCWERVSPWRSRSTAKRLQELYGLDVMVPSVDQRREVDRVIFQELVHGAVHESSKRSYLGIISELGGAGATAVILGCTEIGMLITKADSSLPVFDTTVHHAHAAVDWLCEPAQDPRSAPPRQPRKKH